MKRFHSIVVGALIAFGLRGQDIYQKVDAFKGTTTYFTKMRDPKLEGGSFFSMRYAHMKFIAMKPVADAEPYGILLNAYLPEWMFISSGKSLILKADDKAIELTGSGSADSREIISSDQVSEVAIWTFSLSTLKELAASKSVQFRVYGDRGSLTGTLTEAQMTDLRSFAEKAPGLLGDTKVGGQIRTTPGSYHAGIRYLPMQSALLILAADPGGPNAGLVNQFIVAVEGVKGTGPELQANLTSAIAAHQDGTPVKVTLSGGPNTAEQDGVIALVKK